MTMTVPMVVMLVAALVWLFTVFAQPTKITTWLGDACRILFAAAALVTLLGVTGKPVL